MNIFNYTCNCLTNSKCIEEKQIDTNYEIAMLLAIFDNKITKKNFSEI